MKLLIVLSLIAYGYAAKLDRTYLPPASAASAGGSPGSLTAPGQETSFGQQAAGFQGSQSQPGRGSFNQQSGASQPSRPSFGQTPSGQGQAGLSQAGGFSQPGSSQPSGFGRPSGQSGFGQLPGSNGQTGSNQPSGFGRPSGQSGFGQAGVSQPSNYDQLSGTGVQPAGLGVQPGGFGQSQFKQSVFAQGQRNQGAFSGQNQQPERPQAAADRNAEILRYNNQNDGETFAYDFETSNGISADESGVATNGVQAQGGYSYTGDDGQFYKITYTADENGYMPQGDHLPTPPPIPDEILKSIEENARAAASGSQEGAYNPDEDDSPQQSYKQGQQQQFRGTNGFGPSGPAGQSQNRPQSFQGLNQQGFQQGFKQGSTQPAFKSQGFPSKNRLQGQNGGQGNDQSGYDYSQPQNQGRQPNGNANFIRLGPSKAPGAQNQRRPFQQGQNQPSQSGSLGPFTPNQGQYQAPEFNKLQRQQSGNQGSVSIGSQFNKGSQAGQRTQRPGNQGFDSQYNQNQGSAPTDYQTNQGPVSFAPNRPNLNNQQQPQGFPGQQPSQRQRGPQASQGQRGQGIGGSQNQDGYEYNKPQGAFNSGNQGQFRPQSQGPTGSGSQSGFPGSQGQPGFRGTAGSNHPGSPQGQSQGVFPVSSGANRPGVGSQGQQQGGFPGTPLAPQFPGPRGQSPQGQQPQRTGSQQPYNPLANQTFNQQKQETFGGPRQPPSFSSEEGYKY